MLSSAELDIIRRTAIRGRVALALTCVENAIERFQVRDERIREIVNILWGFVEKQNLASVDEEWRNARAVDLLDAVDSGSAIPESYRRLPAFLPRMLSDVLEIGLAEMYGAVRGYSEETLNLTVGVLEQCRDSGVPVPPVARFGRLPFAENGGWGHAVPRSFFGDPGPPSGAPAQR